MFVDTPKRITKEQYKKGNSNLKTKLTTHIVRYCPAKAIHRKVTKVFLSKFILSFDVKKSENFI